MTFLWVDYLILSLRRKSKPARYPPCTPAPLREFHVSRAVRDKYRFDERFFSITGNVIFANFHASRIFAERMNRERNRVGISQPAIRASELNAMGLIDEILHFLMELYREQKNPTVFAEVLEILTGKLGKGAVEATLRLFVEEFPPMKVYRTQIDPATYLAGSTAGRSNREIALEEMLMLWLANLNPAFNACQELFDDRELKKQSAYARFFEVIQDYFTMQPGFGPKNQDLVTMFRTPARKYPRSVSAQLRFIQQEWGVLIRRFWPLLRSSLDFIREGDKRRFAPEPGPTRIPKFKTLFREDEPEKFSIDLDWMPRLVLIAKSTLVWLDQLSKKYRRPITRLDQIPDAELDILARWGFTGLWLIGLWERSRASKKIKQLCGNPEADASAYAIYDYVISQELGGEEALENLKRRCWKRGIRLASDMVPNHTAVDSKWVMEHPDWFIQLGHSPFPSYTFHGPDLSNNPRVGIYLEDHYYNRSDAAVVFKRVDFTSGNVRYIYHGNDGTSMPWNDTAQLDYLNPQVREAVIQTILRVARMFPIIRFDAAMTLTRKHYQRLWFPVPGTGGDIPSRAEHSLRKDEFDARMPAEFWREVVDRIARQAPDTLLLAEAFWLMEGYFVRTLGMHRVYNSAFMNLLKDEKNKEYRRLVKDTLKFNPEILKRYVNFMNNPDEETAVAQFGKGNKYFGVCTLMVTLPGLPMFGHGQIEGLMEKYGMEYRRAYHDEHPDEALLRRHEKEIFPLMRKRYLFAGVQNFLFYDFITPEGRANENVIAFTNCSGSERALVIYHNKYARTRGWIRTSVPFSRRIDGKRVAQRMQKSLAEGLNLRSDDRYFCIFRDHLGGLEYIRSNDSLRETGFFIELDAYEYHVFLNFREVRDNESHRYAKLHDFLKGRGVPHMEEALKEIILRPLHQAFREMFKAPLIEELIAPSRAGTKKKTVSARLDDVHQRLLWVLKEIRVLIDTDVEESKLAEEIREKLEIMLQMEHAPHSFSFFRIPQYQGAKKCIVDHFTNYPASRVILLVWTLLHALGKISGEEDSTLPGRRWMEEWLLDRILKPVFQELGMAEEEAHQAFSLVKILTSHHNWFRDDRSGQRQSFGILEALMEDTEVRRFIRVHHYGEILWFKKEAFEMLLSHLFVIAVIEYLAEAREGKKEKYLAVEIGQRFAVIQAWLKAMEGSQYQVEKLLGIFKNQKLKSMSESESSRPEKESNLGKD